MLRQNTNYILLVLLVLVASLVCSCGPECDDPSPELELPFETSLTNDTISIGDTVSVRMEFGRFLESPDHQGSIDMIDQEWDILYVSSILDTLANEDYIYRHDESVNFDLLNGEFRGENILSKAIRPEFNEGNETHLIEFNLTFNEPGIYFSSWRFNNLVEDHLDQLECDQQVLWNFKLIEGERNHHLFTYMPDENLFKEEFVQRKDIDGTFAVVVE